MGSNISVTTAVPLTESADIASVGGTGQRCYHCGKTYVKPAKGFYHSPDSFLYTCNNGYPYICKTCVQKIVRALQRKKAHTGTIIQTVCAFLDLPFYPHLARKVKAGTPVALIDEYIDMLVSLPESAPRNYVDSITAGDIGDSLVRAGEDLWDEKSKYNKQYIIGMVGYDPFDDASLNAEARRYLFNTMAGYCPDDTITGDSHKLQSIINIVLAQQQVHVIDELLHKELMKAGGGIDEGTVSKLTAVKKDLLTSIDRLADANEISAKTTKAGKGANTLSTRIQKLMNDKYRGIEVNHFDIKTSEAFQQIADISINAVVKELQFQDNDYTDIITEQRSLLDKRTRENEELAEQNRLLSNEASDLRAQMEKYRQMLEEEGLLDE